MTFTFAVLLGGFVSTYIFLRLLLRCTQDAKEPPAIETSIPFLSPIIGMVTRKSQYYSRNRDKHDLPIYTLRMPGTRLYVVNSTALITAVQRQSMTITFAPIEAKAAVNLTGATEAGKSVLMQNIDSLQGNQDETYVVSYGKAIHLVLSPGASLDALSRAAIQTIGESLEKVKSETPIEIDLFDWVRHKISITTAESVYGPLNPFRDPDVEAAFWKLVPGIMVLWFNLFPSVLAKEALKARQVLVQAFKKYFANGGHNHGSALIKARYDHGRQYNVSLADLARFEVVGSIASLATTGPSAFWLIYHIFSDPIVLEEIRSEVQKFVVPGPSGHTIDIIKVKESCPTLSSTFQEVFRFHSIAASPRLVMEDHMLAGKYLLKKGNTIMIPGAVQHSSSVIWGENVAEFDHKRFARSESKKRTNPVAFRGFGGGTHLCPGRHFARTEILTFAVLMILQFDITPVGGKWVHPTTENSDMSLTMPMPDKDILVELTLRKTGNRIEKLNVILSGSDETITAKDVKDN